jgi:mRNA-degrading endonuclease toxin of MazEF toxin-antitoxin module
VDIPTPVPGMVISYAYLWADEHEAGREEGVKDRPVAIVVNKINPDGQPVVVVLPVTHSPPRNPADAIEIPPDTKRRLGLDDDRSWIVLTETNVFAWPGPDVRAVPHRAVPTISYGLLPASFFNAVRTRLLARHTTGAIRQVPRTE